MEWFRIVLCCVVATAYEGLPTALVPRHPPCLGICAMSFPKARRDPYLAASCRLPLSYQSLSTRRNAVVTVVLYLLMQLSIRISIRMATVIVLSNAAPPPPKRHRQRPCAPRLPGRAVFETVLHSPRRERHGGRAYGLGSHVSSRTMSL
jgi:hypothetical protein